MTKKVAKKVAKKKATPAKSAAKKILKPKVSVIDSLVELIRITSTVVPEDIQRVLSKSMTEEEPNTTASYAMGIIKDNIQLAKFKSQPLCQDTGTVIFFVYHPPGFYQTEFKDQIKKAH
jgi:fumarate hydratase, class I